MLRLLGYHVGETHRVHPSLRESILEYIFEYHLPPVDDVAYFREWGEPNSSSRLKKLANTLAALTRNAKRKDPVSFHRAISEWEQDLLFLHEHYYLNMFYFGWPDTKPFDS